MLRFTQQQEQAVNAARQHFNLTETARAATLPAGEMSLVGNASQVPIDAWRRLDGRAVQIQRDVLSVFNRLATANTTPVSVAACTGAATRNVSPCFTRRTVGCPGRVIAISLIASAVMFGRDGASAAESVRALSRLLMPR